MLYMHGNSIILFGRELPNKGIKVKVIEFKSDDPSESILMNWELQLVPEVQNAFQTISES